MLGVWNVRSYNSLFSPLLDIDLIILFLSQAEWVGACFRYLPGFPVVLLTPSPAYASSMLAVPNLHFGLLNYSFAAGGRDVQFISRARNQQQRGRMIFSWSDNADQWMARSIRNGVDGVITDDPRRFIELCSQWDDARVREGAGRWTLWELVFWMGITINVWVTETIRWLTQGSPDMLAKTALGISI